jgi:hypothetical protein
LKSICANFTVIRDNVPADFPNVYMSCADGSAPYCQDKKLIIPQDSQIFDVFADDILNPIKEKYISSGLLLNNTIDYFKFNINPHERITIQY